jgi:hypothetical protein
MGALDAGHALVGTDGSSAAMTIRGREISEPTLWAVGGLVAVFTPVTALVMLPMLIVGGMADNDLVGIGLVLAVAGLLTWWHARTRAACRAASGPSARGSPGSVSCSSGAA